MEAAHIVQQGTLQLGALLMLWLISRALWHLVWRPYAVARRFERQGIRGPPYRLVVGSVLECRRMLAAGRAAGPLDAGCHDYTSLLYPFLQKWASDYGKTFLFWFGPVPAICSTDMEFVKQVLADRTDLFPKGYLNHRLEDAIGKGIILVDGDVWKRHRKVVHPVFNQDKLKSISEIMSGGTRQLMERWCGEIQESSNRQTETDMKRDSQELALEVITRVVFGNDYKEFNSKEMLGAMNELQALVMTASLDPPIPGFRYLPIRRNRRSRQLNKFFNSKMMEIIKARLAGSVKGDDDLLGMTLEAWSDGERLSIREVIDECKTIFFAGRDTTANLLTWVMFLLGRYPLWQEKVREEVLRECPDEVPSVDTPGKLKLLNMCVLEALRLYNPVPFVMRRTASDAMVADIKVPKGTEIMIPVAMLHRDKDVWGPDAHEFNPMRFENGVSRAAKHPNALLAFSYGPRVCTGQSFAMTEVRTSVVMFLRRFSFSVSPAYMHMPIFFVTLMPRYEVPLIVRKLQPDG